KICIYTHQTTNLIADIAGYHPEGSSFVPLSPRRFLDSRPGYSTVDGRSAGQGVIGAGQTLELSVAGRSGVAADAVAVSLNIAAVDPQASGFLTVWPCGEPRPNSSALNFQAGVTIANAITVPIGSNGKICIYTHQTTNLIADIAGYDEP
ncbi:MAG: hypothetical protein ACO3WU_04515, partial [Ilumatobacteraceae bacterium]